MMQRSFHRIGITALSFLMLGFIAFSWLIFPYFMNGDKMMFETGEQVRNERYYKYTTLSQILTRSIPFPGGIEVKVLYASNEYFEYADRGSAVEVFRPDTHLVFFVNEDVHTGYLPQGLAGAVLEIDGRRFDAVSSEGPDLVEHHRTTIIRFSRFDENGNPIITANAKDLRLILTHPWDRYKTDGVEVTPVDSMYVWQLPLEIPDELKSRDTFTQAMVLSLSAGLLASVLTPCLIQLVLIFFATLGGMSAREVSISHTVTREARRRILWVATCFVTAYVGLFVASGALIGYAGKEAQLFFANYTRPVGIVSGIIVILFGIWIGVQSRAPLVCRIPGADLISKIQGKGTLATVMISIAFSLGCMSCFGGAIIGTLFIYVGALGSASAGAAVMGLFAVGVAIPFLLAAVFFSKMRPVFDFVARHYQAVGTVSTVVIIAFGLLLVTDKFHTVSDLIYPWLGLD